MKHMMILACISDLASSFLYYDRKEDSILPENSIQKAVGDGDITIDEIVAKFREELEKGLTVK